MNAFKIWKRAFDGWETHTAELLESTLSSPLMLEPAGKLLALVTGVEAKRRQAAERVWSSLGLATRRDQERALFAMNELSSKLLDLEEKLESLTRD